MAALFVDIDLVIFESKTMTFNYFCDRFYETLLTIFQIVDMYLKPVVCECHLYCPFSQYGSADAETEPLPPLLIAPSYQRFALISLGWVRT